MEEKEKKQPIDKRIVGIDDRPHIYITPFLEKRESPGKGGTRPPASFFGHHIGKLLDPEKAEAEEFISIDKELESSLETVRRKLQMIRPPSPYGESRVSEEEIKHRF